MLRGGCGSRRPAPAATAPAAALVALVVCACAASAAAAAPPFNVTVGYLTAVKGELKDRQGLAVSGAFSMAVDEINKDKSVLPNVHLDYRWADTKGETVQATKAITDMLCEGVIAFFGPEGPCYVEAIVTQARNIPMIAYKCSDYKASNIPTFARTEPPDTQVTKSVISLLKYYRWYKFSIIHEESWLTVALSLENHAKQFNMTVNHLREVVDPHKCCDQHLACCNSGYWYQVIQETKNRTRIYIFLGTSSALIDMMVAMDAVQLFARREYMVIFVDMQTYSPREAQRYLWKPDQLLKLTNCHMEPAFKPRAQSLLVIVSSAPSDNYENFTEKVRDYNSREPFNFSTPNLFNRANYVKFVSIYAAYLYDAVRLYAWALHKLLQQESGLTASKIREIASNGTKIIETIILNRTFKSVTGSTIRLDEFGDSEGNFSVLALKPCNYSQKEKENCSCDYHMVPVGHFQQGPNGDFPEYRPNPRVPIDWPDNVKPEDEPSCGFNNEQCPKDDTHVSSLVMAGTLAVILFCATVVTISIYRKWKIEQEIEGLLWKIDIHEIYGYANGNEIVSSPSKLSLASAGSFESRCGAQIFAATGQYRGNVVRIKELKFCKKKDISRDLMKEMRLLRDLRHDNINSFIGACIEPMRVLLVSDYCAKGSLYDIIENEDIKLDNMFIASLVHDLIKGMSFIHSSFLGWHGNLKSSNCIVTSRWMLQVTDFGLHDLRHFAENDSIGEHQYYRSLFWKAPEILRSIGGNSSVVIRGSQKGDVYAFAIILYEIIGRRGPFGFTAFEPKEIVEMVKRYPAESDEPFRPDVCSIAIGTEDCVLSCMKDCWAEDPDIRPDFHTIRTRLKKMKGRKTRNIMDQMMDMMEKYANNLEELVNERTRLLFEEKQKTEDLLHRMLPQPVAKRLTTGHGVEPESFDSVTIYFSDIVGFTAMSAESTPLQVVNFLNDLYTVFDRIIKGYDVYKVETIGDAYMVVSGLPLRNDDSHCGEIASMSLDLLDAVKNHKISHRPNETLKLRIGVHTGPVVAGVVGLTMPRYCLFGDTVNTASRMESTGEALKIHISPQCKLALEKLGGYQIDSRGAIPIKGKGQVETFWLVGATDKAIQRRAVDIGDLPPLFCRPRRSPKMSESRQASLVGIPGIMSRRQSSIPRSICDPFSSVGGMDSCSSLGRDSPRQLSFKTKLATNTADTFVRPRRVLSSIASSTVEERDGISIGGAVVSPPRVMRGAQSLDVLPRIRKLRLPTRLAPRDMSRSLDLSSTIATVSGKDLSGIINGNAIGPGESDFITVSGNVDIFNNRIREEDSLLLNCNSSVIDPCEPSKKNKQYKANCVMFPSKKWRSLEAVSGDPIDRPDSKKLPRGSIRSWLFNIFNGSNLRTSDISLRKATPLLDRESVV